jgi:hypothetical protein
MMGGIREQLQVAPSEPFTIVTTSGARYPLPSADHAGLSPRGNWVIVWFDDDCSVTISVLHIAAIEKGLSNLGGNGETEH